MANFIQQIRIFISQGKRIILLLMILAISGCAPRQPDNPDVITTPPIPTMHPLLLLDSPGSPGSSKATNSPQTGPTVANVFHRENTPTTIPTSTLISTLAALKTQPALQESLTADPVFNDSLNPNWLLLENMGMNISEVNPPYVFQGETALAATPLMDFASLYFSVKAQNQTTYPRQRVLGVSFWVNGGENSIQVGDLAVAVVGSNQYSYWVADDRSVYVTDESPFSETRLNYLGFNRTIPPNTWVKVQVWLDDLIFDPYYQYVTGFYIKNDRGFSSTFYLDEVEMMLLKDDGTQAAPVFITPLPKSSSTSDPVTPAPDVTSTVTGPPTKTPTPTRKPTLTPTQSPTPTPTVTKKPTLTLTITPTRRPSLTPSLTPTSR